MSVERSVETDVEEALKTRGFSEMARAFHNVNSDSTLAPAFKSCSLVELENLSTSPQALLRLLIEYLKTEEARPFLLSEEVEEAMRRLNGVPDSVRRAAGLVVLLGRFYASDSRSEEDSVPR